MAIMGAIVVEPLLALWPFEEGNPVHTMILFVCMLVAVIAPLAIVLAILSVRRKRLRKDGRKQR